MGDTQTFVPRIVAFCCQYCAYAAADLAGSMRLQYDPNIRIVLVPCTGRVDVIHLLRAIEDGADGVFLAGLAHYPKPLDETIAQADAAASHAAQILARGYVEAPGMVSSVDSFLCRGCGRCVEICPFGVPELKETKPGVFISEINPALCKGCGACGVVCPTGAAAIRHYKDDQVGDMIDAAFA